MRFLSRRGGRLYPFRFDDRLSASILFLLTACLVAIIASQAVLPAAATSHRTPPLKRIDYATDVSIDIVRRKADAKFQSNQRRSVAPASVLYSDSLRITFSAFEQIFHLHLEPNDEIVPPDGATLNNFSIDPHTGQKLPEKTTIRRESIRAYHGIVVHPDHSSTRASEDARGVDRLRSGFEDSEGVVGQAAIFIHDSDDDQQVLHLEGHFDWNGNTHNVQSATKFDRARQREDPKPHKRALEQGHLIVHRDSDIMSSHEWLAGRASASPGAICRHDRHAFNRDMSIQLNDDNFFAEDEETSASLAWAKRSWAWWEPRASVPASSGSDMGHMDLMSKRTSEPVPFQYTLQRRQSDTKGTASNSSFASSIGSTRGCPNSAQVVYIGMAADCTFTQVNNGSTAQTAAALLSIMNSVSGIYKNNFNISLGVVALEVRNAVCPTDGDVNWNRGCGSLTMDDRLSLFSSWIGTLPTNNGTGAWELLTNCATGGELGVAWLGTLCMSGARSEESETVAAAAVVANAGRNVQVVAHETGHIFGAIHDCTDGCSLQDTLAFNNGGAFCCPSARSSCDDSGAHIMSPVAETNTQTFSQCSIGNICSMIGSGLNTSCIQTPGQRMTLSEQQCGNGILELDAGEECDAGPEGSACCTTKCKLVTGAQCDPTTSACCESDCRFSPSTTLCRASKDDSDCDQPEYCTGNNATCPVDRFASNGRSCTSPSSSSSGLSCANGRCTSRDLQCRQQVQDSSESYSRACSVSTDQSCSLSCQDPDQALVCTVFQSNFVDGTSCGYGGFCQGGECQRGDWKQTFAGWYRNNLQIAIPVTVGIALLVLILLALLLRGCSRLGERRSSRSTAFSSARSVSVTTAPPPPPLQRTSQTTYQQQHQPPAYPTYSPPNEPPPATAGRW